VVYLCKRRDAISNLLKLKTPIGPQVSRGFITLTFFEYREQKGFFWQSRKEKVCFERWHISVVVDDTPLPHAVALDNGVDAVYTRSSSGSTMTATNENVEMRIWSTVETARDQIQDRILTILEVYLTAVFQ
jgi:hypothetical protein